MKMEIEEQNFQVKITEPFEQDGIDWKRAKLVIWRLACRF